MALPYSSTANIPQGLPAAVTIDSVAYIVEDISLATEQGRPIQRSDENGDKSDLMVRESSEFIQGTITLQRALTSTAVPPAGETFSCDYDRSGTASTLLFEAATVERSKDDFDKITSNIYLISYQS